MEILYSENIKVENIKAEWSPYWTIWFYNSSNILIENVTIYNPPESHNCDGIDIDSSHNVLIQNNQITTIDDFISLKSGSGNF